MTPRAALYRVLLLAAVGLAVVRPALLLTRMSLRGELGASALSGESPDPDERLLRETERAVARLRPFLPSRGRIGYRSSIPNDRLMRVGQVGATRRFLAFRYALAPLVVVADDREALVVANFPAEESLLAFAREEGCTLTASHGGVGLLGGCRPRS